MLFEDKIRPIKNGHVTNKWCSILKEFNERISELFYNAGETNAWSIIHELNKETDLKYGPFRPHYN